MSSPKKPTAKVSEEKIKSVAKVIQKAKNAYYNTDQFLVLNEKTILGLPSARIRLAVRAAGGVVKDSIYDLLEDWLKEKDPENEVLAIGAPVKKVKVKLPMPMPSLDKRKPDTVDDWLKEKEIAFLISDKVDGVSLGIVQEESLKLYTRGDGSKGGDISFMAKSLRIPENLPKGTKVRAEVVMPTSNFGKWADKFANPRNMVSGITNRNSLHKGLKDCKVLAYQIIGSKLTPSKQIEQLIEWGFETPYVYKTKKISSKKLSTILEGRKIVADYAIDGLVIARDEVSKISKSNPKHMVAFKNNEAEEHAEVEVFDVIWRNTRTGVLFPRIMISPVVLGGVTITYASGKSGAFIRDNKVGQGSIISIARGGDVIPDIRAVVKPANEWQEPTVAYEFRGEHCFALKQAEDAIEQYLEFFFEKIGVEKFKAATLKKVVAAGYTTPESIFNLSKEELVELTSKNGNGIYDQIHKDNEIFLPTLMYASQIFGRSMGSSRLEEIVRAIPNILKMKGESRVTEAIDAIKGFDEITAKQFSAALPSFKEWLDNESPYSCTVNRKSEGFLCKGHAVLFSGVRDKALQEQILAQGGSVVGSVGKCNILIVADVNSDSSKVREAKSKNQKSDSSQIEILTIDDYSEKYKL